MTTPLRLSVVQRLIVILSVTLPATSSIVEGSGNGELLLGGNDKALWIVRCEPGAKTFDLVAKPAGEKWQWVAQRRTGLPGAAAAVGDRLHMFFDSRAYHTFGGDGHARTEIDVKGSAPLAVCYGRDFGTPRGPIVAVIRGDSIPSASTVAQTLPHGSAVASSPAGHAAKPPRLVVLRYVLILQRYEGSREPMQQADNAFGMWNWVRLSPDLEGPRLSAEAQVMAAAAGEKLYVLTSAQPQIPNRLDVWADGNWRQVPLSGKVAEQLPVAMLAVQQRLLILLAEPVGKTQRRRIHIAVPGPDGESFTYQPIAQDGKAGEWSASSLPLAGQFGGGEIPQLALLWRDDDAMKLAKCDPNGQLTAPEDVDVFERRPGGAGRVSRGRPGRGMLLPVPYRRGRLARRVRRLRAWVLPPTERD